MPARNERPVDRRGFLRAAGGTAVGVGALGTTGSARAQSSGWFDGVENYENVADEAGNGNVTVAVGAKGNGGNFAFDPPAVRVDPGTTVVWEWTGEGGGHNVVAENGAFESDIVSEKGHTFEHTFEKSGAAKYACIPHKSMGMRGAVLVGGDASIENSAKQSSDDSQSPYGDWLDDVDDFEKVIDRTGSEHLEIQVGAPGNGGNFAFDPPAVHIDPGTTVEWRWTEGSAGLPIVAEDESFWTGYEKRSGDSFEWTFSGNRVVKYACPAYKELGMKGLLVVGNPDMPSAREVLSTPWGGALVGSGLLALLSPLALGVFLAIRGDGRDDEYNSQQYRR